MCTACRTCDFTNQHYNSNTAYRGCIRIIFIYFLFFWYPVFRFVPGAYFTTTLYDKCCEPKTENRFFYFLLSVFTNRNRAYWDWLSGCPKNPKPKTPLFFVQADRHFGEEPKTDGVHFHFRFTTPAAAKNRPKPTEPFLFSVRLRFTTLVVT